METEDNPSDFINSLKCPITYEFFRDPVIGADGHTYERENITIWIRKHATSPITRESMDLKSLRPNFIVKKMVEDFLSLSSQKQYRFRLDIDICKAKQRPIFQSPSKTIYEANWISKQGPPIVLIRIDGAKAKREASFYVQLSCHPHIVRTYGLVDSNTSDGIMLVQEYAPEGDLSELLRNNTFQPSFEVLIEIFRQIVDAMICLADNQIIHGDLACRNVLVFRSNSTQPMENLVKLTDFGLTRTGSLFSIIDSPASSTLNMIPVRYAAPELLVDASATSYSEKSDVYSFGVLMWEACSHGAVPYGNLETTDVVYQEKLKGKLLEQPRNCSDDLWNIILDCTQNQTNLRPSFKDVQESLLNLRFEKKRLSSNRMSQMECASEHMKNRISSTNSYQRYNTDCFSKDNPNAKQIDSPIYQNIGNISSNYTRPISSQTTTVSPGDYYIPCEYCLQSVNNDDFDTHKEVCTIRRLVQWFAKMVAQLPLLELTSCQYCEDIIPLNMLNIHQNTCNPKSTHLHNAFRQSHQQLPSTDAYVTSVYLKPTSMPVARPEENTYENILIPNQYTQNLPVIPTTHFETSNQSSDQHEPMIVSTAKRPKTGFLKALSKFKKKMT